MRVRSTTLRATPLSPLFASLDPEHFGFDVRLGHQEFYKCADRAEIRMLSAF